MDRLHNRVEIEYHRIQDKLRFDMNLVDVVNLSKVRILAGVDIAYWEKGGIEYGVCCIVVLDYLTKKVIEQKEFVGKVEVPYIPGCLAFREIPLFLEAYKKVVNQIDILLFDGNGYLHPRHMGLATHAGILLEKPTIGIAKSYYRIENASYVIPEDELFAYSDIISNGEIYGRVLRTMKGVKPIYVSVGNRIDLDSATEVACRMTEKESHIPLPTRLADLMTHEVRRKYKDTRMEC